MFTPVRAAVLKFFKVPPEPELPSGSPGSVRTFRAAPNFLKLKLLIWGARQAAVFAGLAIFIAVWQVAGSGVPREINITVNVVKAFSVLAFLVQLPITYAIVRLDWEMRWYIVTDRSLRIRAGIWHVQEMTIPSPTSSKSPCTKGRCSGCWAFTIWKFPQRAAARRCIRLTAA